MFMKMDPKSNKKRDGRHCDLCGCSFPAVRCDKCNSQIFCLSCDDMYHRHPKRRFHLRKAVDPTPTPSARPVLPMKISNLPVAPGDPSKMPLPPPRKKKSSKSIFNTFRKGSPASDTSPTLPKKEYSWSDRFGSIKKFMSQRPLPPVPNDENEDFPTDVARTSKNGFSFIHSKGEEQPPALPQRNQMKPPEHFPFQNYANNNVQDISTPHENGFSHSESSRNATFESSNQWPNEAQHNNWKQSTRQSLPYSENEQNFGTIRRQSQPLSSSSSAHEKESGMHSSSSVTDLHMLSSMPFNPGMPAYPQYPFNPHMASQYQGPFPMYPQYPAYPQYFGNSWANLSSPLQTTDGDFSDQSENSAGRFQHMRNPVYKDKKAKRSQSVVVDRMSYQGQFYPYGPFLSGGYPPPPWISAHHVKEAPPSPATSLRSHSRQSQRRRKVTDDDDDLSSSPLSRPKSSSSEVSKLPQEVRKPICSTSSSDEEVEKDKRRSKASPAMERRQLKQDMLKRRASSPKQPSASRESPLLGRRYSADNKKTPKSHALKMEYKESLENTGRDFSKAKFKSEEEENKYNAPLGNKEYDQDHIKEDSSPLERWHCKHCTFLNEPGERICRVCCKTAPKMNKLLDGTLQSVENNDNSQESFNKKQDMNLLSSALDEAEKEITRSLDELLKIKEESSEQEEHSQEVKFNQSNVKFVDHVSPMKPLEDIPVAHEVTHTNTRTTPENISGSVNKNAASSISYIENDKQQINQEAVSITKSEISQPNDIATSSPSCIYANKTEVVPPTSANTINSESQTLKDSFCQTYQDVVLPEFPTEKKNTDSNVPNKNCVHPLDRIPNTQSPLPHDTYHLGRGVNGIFGLHRAHSRASLFGGRLSDASPITHEYGGMDLIPSSLYRSLSRTSLLGDAEGWTSEYHSRHKPDFYLSMEELVERRRQESMRAQGLELVRMIREAEQQGFTADDIQVALNNCGKQNPVNWLQENWKTMIHTVLTLATNYGRDKKENDVGGISQNEARDALRLHKGNIWAAVTECVEGRQRKLLELSARGNFTFCEIVDALTLSEGNVEIAYSELTKTSLKPFLMRVWGSGEGAQNLDAARPELFDYKEKDAEYTDGIKFSDTIASDKSASIEDIWEEDDYDEEEWEENFEENFRDGDLENTAEIVEAEKTSISEIKHDLDVGGSDELDKSSTFVSLLTPESEKSEYCDATGGSSLVERCLSSTSIDEIYLVGVEDDDIFEQDSSLLLESNAKGTGFLKKLANLKKGGMVPSKDSNTNKNNTTDEDFDKSFEEKLNIAQHSDFIKTKSTNIADFNLQDNSELPSPTLNDEANQNLNKKKASPPLSEKRIIVVHDKIVNESNHSEKTSHHISSESAISDSVSSEDKINTSLIPEINFEKREQFSKMLSKLTIPSSLTSVNKLNNGKKNIGNEVTIENDPHSENVDTVHNEAGICCANAKEIAHFQNSNEIDERINGTEATLSYPSECSNFPSVERKKLNSFNEAVKLESSEENVIFKNKLDEYTNIEQDNKSIADVKDVDVSSKNDLRVMEFCHNKQGKENAEYVRENVFSKINDEPVAEKNYSKSDMNDDDETKATLLHVVSIKNNAIEKLEKHDEDKIPTLPIDITTGDPVFLTRDGGNPEITVEIKTSVTDKHFSGSNESFSAMNSTVEENDTKMPTTDQNQESPIIITNNETGDKVHLIVDETLTDAQKDNVKLDTANTLKNAISVKKLIKPDNHAISEKAMNAVTAHEIETRMLENEGHINIFNLPPDYDMCEISDYVKPPVKTDISASNHLELHNSPKSNNSKFFEEDLKSLTTSNASTEFRSLGNSSHNKDNLVVNVIKNTMQDNEVNIEMFMSKPSTSKSPTQVYAEELQVEEDQKGAFENNDLENSIENEEILVTTEVSETSTNISNLNSQNLEQNGIINIDTQTHLVKELPDSSNINNSNSVIKQQDISNTSNAMNENSAFIPEKANEENTLESLKEKGENISKVKSRNNLGVSKVKGKRLLEISKIEKINTPESLKIERKNTPEILKMKKNSTPEISKIEVSNTPGISKMEGNSTLEIIQIEENNILEVKGVSLLEVSKDKKESTQTGLGTEERYASEAKETSTSEVSEIKKQNISEMKGEIALEVEKKITSEMKGAIASEVEKEIASEVNETITPEEKELQILEAKQIVVSDVEERNISEVSKVIQKHSSEVSNVEEASTSKIKVLDNVLKSGISRNIPKLSNESQFHENTDEAGELIVSTSTDLFTSNKSEESVNDHVDNSVSDTNNELSTQPNTDKNNKLHLATTYTSTVVENSNLTLVPFLKNVLDDSSVQAAAVDNTITIPVNKTSIQTSSSIEENTDTVKNEELPPTVVDSPSRNETVSDDDISTTNGGLGNRPVSPVRPVSHLRRMSFNTRKEAIIQERNKDLTLTKIGESKPWFLQKKIETFKPALPKRSIKQQLEFERRVRKLVADKKCRTYRKAEIIVQLLDMNFDEFESIDAANECSTLEQAISFLQQECQLCAGNYPIRDIISMVHCSHMACRECIRAYFTIQIRDRTIMELLCPFCNEPDITDEDVAQDYFNHLDIMLKKLVEEDIHELFQRKLRDRVLMKDPNFMWCTQCASGFIADPYLKRLICPDCKAIMCASCRRLWEKDHEGMSCEAFAAFKDSLDPQITGLDKVLIENGIDCPSCHFKYSLAKGGCMHFKCIQCQHDFCSGCSKPFKMGQKCGMSDFCAKLGLHAHHPRNCLFYLRDKEPDDLQKLLDMNDIKYDKDQPENVNKKLVCQVMEQKETAHGMLDDICGKEVQDGYAGLCRLHYVEYLGQLVNKHKIDPIQIFDNDDLELVLKRASIRMPPRKYREAPDEYRIKLLQVIEEKLPLVEVDRS